MRRSSISTALSVLLLSVPVTPLPDGQPLEKRTIYAGRGTWFYDGLGACGWINSNSDRVVALSSDMYDDGGHCGEFVTITNDANGETVTATVADRCPGCDYGDLDLSQGAFEEIGDLDAGVVWVSWSFDI